MTRGTLFSGSVGSSDPLVPEAEETIRSRVPAFRYKDRPLVSMGASKQHLSLFIMHGAVLETYGDELEDFELRAAEPRTTSSFGRRLR
jgi:uncharacterized protein YdhG (YjbR/CyaY superfamily)